MYSLPQAGMGLTMLQGDGFRVIDVEGLGQPALVVNTLGPRLLLLDAALSHDERMQIMSCVVGRYSAA